MGSASSGGARAGSPPDDGRPGGGSGAALFPLRLVQELGEAYRLIAEQLARVIVGQKQVIEELMIALFARGHCLLVGVPGLAKTLLVSTLSRVLDLNFNRIQFTPDLMPSDITGTLNIA